MAAMTEITTTTIKKIAADMCVGEKIDTVLDSLNAYWKRAKDEKNDTQLGKFDINRTDLTQYETNFVFDWCQVRKLKKQGQVVERKPIVSASRTYVPHTSAPMVDLQAQIQTALAKQKEQLEKIHSDEIATKITEGVRVEMEKYQLMQNAILSDEKVALLNDFNDRLEEKINIRTQALLDGFRNEKEALNILHTEELNALKSENTALLEKITRLESMIEKLQTKPIWYRISEYDIVNVTSNLFGAVSLINMLGVWGVLAAIILILTFRGVLKALKKYSSSFFTVALGIALIVVVEFIYGALHTVFFKDILEGKQHLPFDMTYMDAAFYLAIIISGASIAVAVMTSLQTADDAEQQRIDEIDSRLQNQ